MRQPRRRRSAGIHAIRLRVARARTPLLGGGGRAAVFPWQDHAVLHHGSDEDDGRVRWKASARLPDETVDFLQTKGLQTGGQFPAQLVERFAPLLCGAPLGQLVLLPNDAEDEQDDRGGRESEWRRGGARFDAHAGGDPRDSRAVF